MWSTGLTWFDRSLDDYLPPWRNATGGVTAGRTVQELLVGLI